MGRKILYFDEVEAAIHEYLEMRDKDGVEAGEVDTVLITLIRGLAQRAIDEEVLKTAAAAFEPRTPTKLLKTPALADEYEKLIALQSKVLEGQVVITDRLQRQTSHLVDENFAILKELNTFLVQTREKAARGQDLTTGDLESLYAEIGDIIRQQREGGAVTRSVDEDLSTSLTGGG